jgi:spore coat polysaccharide biosynthesis protein SpsF
MKYIDHQDIYIDLTGMTEQERFWAGEFGDEYAERHAIAGPEFEANKLAMFSRILQRIEQPGSIREFGSNTGGNLWALSELFPHAELSGVEINAMAVDMMQHFYPWEKVPDVEVCGITESARREVDLVLTMGLLIHIPPEELPKVYSKLVDDTGRYILLIEYYNPTPVEIPYRGHSGRLWKRDFAGEMLDNYPLRLIDYGFVYHRDVFPQDDVTWFLMEVE